MLVGLVVWCLFGLLAGGLARLIVPGRQRMGCLGTMVVGILGSVTGGFLGHLLFHGTATGFKPAGLVGAVLGSVVILVVLRLVGGRSAGE